MFIEGHWKALKRDFLYKFFRPCLDFVTYINLLKMIPLQERKFQQILAGREHPNWKKQFKAEWKRLSKHDIKNAYMTNAQNWVCSYPYFLTNRFMICKHLIQLKGIVDPKFFYQIHRNHNYPFIQEGIQEISYEGSIVTRTMNISENSTDPIEEVWNEHAIIYDWLINVTEKALNILKEYKEAKNSRWIKGVERNFILIEAELERMKKEPTQNMVRDIETYRNRRTMPLTWKDHSNNTRFLN